ncbi:CidA/LrgA family protein [Alicyclobacillus sp. SO9]|uniref:CidA/LrgA family protein n=1 Tax=Alicyclobacillus sp. SO9 TaxID=2665646 RepID=UPI001E4A17F9|nr:CidA/LrgA family holin-like protein [Alicyclobacillus sp. SO9]
MSAVLKTVGKTVLQVTLLTLMSLLGELIVRVTHLHLPASLIGLVVLFLLLQLKIVKVEWFELGANLLLAEMLLFFVPSATGIVQYGGLVKTDGWRLLLVIGASTLCVMLISGVLTEFWMRGKERRHV